MSFLSSTLHRRHVSTKLVQVLQNLNFYSLAKFLNHLDFLCVYNYGRHRIETERQKSGVEMSKMSGITLEILWELSRYFGRESKKVKMSKRVSCWKGHLQQRFYRYGKTVSCRCLQSGRPLPTVSVDVSIMRPAEIGFMVIGKEQEDIDNIHEHGTLSKTQKVLNDKTHPFYPFYVQQ